MAEPIIIGDLIAGILEALHDNAVEKGMEDDWEDVTDIITLPCERGVILQDLKERHVIDFRTDGFRIKAYKPDLLRIFGTTDFRVRRRLHHD